MAKKIIWLLVSCLMVLSLVMASCGPAAEEEEEKEVVGKERPEYGGTLNRIESNRGTPSTWRHNPLGAIADGPPTNEMIWEGDWAKGPAGGYGTGETDWAHSYDRYDQKRGHIAEKVDWVLDEPNETGTIIITVRQGVHWAINEDSEAARLVGGREMTTDDVLYCLDKRVNDETSYVHRANPELWPAEITKTGPWEIQIKLPLSAMVAGLTRLMDCCWIYPPEVMEKYGKLDWDISVGTGPFILKEYISDSHILYHSNPDYWMKNPVGPGKGDQLPYIDALKYLIITDKSTQLAALRTGKIDYMESIDWEEASELQKSVPDLLYLEKTSNDGRGTPCGMRTDKAPFNDVRVRRAMVMAIDYYDILENFRGGKGNIISYPHGETASLRDLYLGIDDPDLPASIKELFVYSPEKSKQLLAEAGYPNGFKTTMVLTNTEVDYYSIIKDMWAKVGIELEFNVVEPGVKSSIQIGKEYDALLASTTAPIASYYLGIDKHGKGMFNISMIDDPVIDKALEEVRLLALKDSKEAQLYYREHISKYCLDQAYGINNVEGYFYTFWWPWMKNFSGERSVGYDDWHDYVKYFWLDQDLKEEMGY